MIFSVKQCCRYERKCLFLCIYNPQITVSPTSLFSANLNRNHVKNHPKPWTCPLNLTDNLPTAVIYATNASLITCLQLCHMLSMSNLTDNLPTAVIYATNVKPHWKPAYSCVICYQSQTSLITCLQPCHMLPRSNLTDNMPTAVICYKC